MLDPQFAHNIKRVVLMGGAVMVPGNVNPVAEANTFCDPEAAQLVIDAPWEVTWVGLEATSRTALTPQMIEQLEATSTPHGQFMWRAMRFYIDLYEQNLGHRTCLLHDPLAMALALDPGLATYRAVPAQIELRGSHTRGQVVADLRTTVRQGETNDPGMIRIVDDLNLEKFHQRFLDSFET